MYEPNAYTVRDVTLSRADSDRWDAANNVERRALITDKTPNAHAEWEGHTIRLFHSDGRLLAKTVLHRPLFAGRS
jgi:hypothetical protein